MSDAVLHWDDLSHFTHCINGLFEYSVHVRHNRMWTVATWLDVYLMNYYFLFWQFYHVLRSYAYVCPLRWIHYCMDIQFIPSKKVSCLYVCMHLKPYISYIPHYWVLYKLIHVGFLWMCSGTILLSSTMLHNHF